METLYRKVAVSERLPKDYGFYFIISINGVQKSYWFNGVKFFVDENISVKYWLEEIPENSLKKLKADKTELLEALEKVKEWGSIFGIEYSIYDEIESLIKKHKQ